MYCLRLAALLSYFIELVLSYFFELVYGCLKPKKDCLKDSLFCQSPNLAFEHIAEFLVEFVHAAGRVNDFLLAGVKRVAFRANFDVEAVFGHGRLGGERVAARAGNVYIVVVRMNIGFHG